MLLPYRVKNPVKNFPIATVSIIVLNFIVYLCTTHFFLFIREEVVKDYAFALGETPFFTFITSAFLHGDIFHILGNMLFLWVFGRPVEDRLGIPKYLALYFTAGLVGDLLQAALDYSIEGQIRPVIGASGCIMGVVGAYWYLYSWSTVCVFYWLGWFFHGVWEVAALWIIGIFMFMDVANGVLYGASGVSGGVANFAHLGGSAAGILLCFALKIKRDSEAVSEAKAFHADARDLNNVPLHALQTMLENEPGSPELIRAMILPATRLGQQSAIDNAFAQAGPGLITKDPGLVAHYLIDLRGNPGIYNSVHLLRLGGMLERSGSAEKAFGLYKIIVDTRPQDPEVETALYKMASCAWNVFKDAQSARMYLSEIQRRFPHGEMLPFAKALWQRIV